MQPVLNVEDIKRVEIALTRVGVSVSELMHRAGYAAAHEARGLGGDISHVVSRVGDGLGRTQTLDLGFVLHGAQPLDGIGRLHERRRPVRGGLAAADSVDVIYSLPITNRTFPLHALAIRPRIADEGNRN